MYHILRIRKMRASITIFLTKTIVNSIILSFHKIKLYVLQSVQNITYYVFETLPILPLTNTYTGYI